VADDKVSILAAQAQLGQDVDVAVTREELAAALAEASPAPEDSSEAKYARALLRAADDQA
jgi:F-type H+-transporting ATPase subunit epsilon